MRHVYYIKFAYPMLYIKYTVISITKLNINQFKTYMNERERVGIKIFCMKENICVAIKIFLYARNIHVGMHFSRYLYACICLY